MIDYSIYLWKNPMDEKSVEMAYAKNQLKKVMPFDEFVKHISDHNGVFTRGTVKGVVSDTCTCLVEQLLNGYKVAFGELGVFSISLTSDPAPSLKEFSTDNIKAVNLLFTPGADFENLRSKAEFNLVASRSAQTAVLKAIKAGQTTVDLTSPANQSGGGSDGSSSGGSQTPSGSGSQTPSGGSDSGGSGSQGGSSGDDDAGVE